MQKLSFKITHNTKNLSSFSGLKVFYELFPKFEIQSLFGAFLPKKQRGRGFSSWNKFFALCMGFIAGAECLDDFDDLGLDPLFGKMTGSPSAVTLGNFLRSFRLRQIEELISKLPVLALKIRLWLQPQTYKITFKMDGTLL